MVEKLELRYLANYLPYGLKMLIKFPVSEEIGELKTLGLHPYNGDGEGRITVFVNTDKESGRQIILHKNSKNQIVKPLLIPLSELKPDFLFYELGSSMPENFIKEVKSLQCTYTEMEFLISKHYDVFGLIDAGLALNKLNYEVKA